MIKVAIIYNNVKFRIDCNSISRLLYDENYTSEACQANIKLAEQTGRYDLIRTWSLLSEITNSNLSFGGNDPWASPFYIHPFGRQLVMSL